MLLVPSLKPIRLRGVAWLLLVLDVRPKPSWNHRIATDAPAEPGQVADRVERDLRVVRARLDAQVAAAAVGLELVAGERRACRPARPGARPASPKPVVEQASARSRS